MLLKTVKEVGRFYLGLGAGALSGFLAGFGYLYNNGFECAKNHIDPGVSFDFSKLNYTEVMQMFLNHNGTIHLPIEIHPTADLSACETPLIIGAAVGAGVGTLWLAAHYAEKYRKQREKVAEENESSLLQSERAMLLDV